MKGARRIIYLLLLLSVFGSPSGQNVQQAPRYIQLYRQAEKLYYSDNSNDRQDSLALSLYKKSIELHPDGADSILWDSYFKAGIYLQTENQFPDAIPYFHNAIALQRSLPQIAESLIYLPNLYLGNSYYSSSMLDSAVYYYKKAEEIAVKHPTLDGIERLYNTLGAVNYESGDYQQSKIYFEKAIQLVSERQPGNIPLMVNYQNNYASALRNMKDYNKAMEIFTGLLKYNVNRDEILHNIGNIYLEQGKDSLAVSYLLKVSYDNQNKFNDLGVAYIRLNEPDSAFDFYKKAAELNFRLNGNRKNLQYAITCKNLGDYFKSKKLLDSSINRYQQSIIQLVYDFNENDPRLSPAEFNGQFSVIELFEAISSKARAFTLRYEENKNKNDLLSSIVTYNSLYSLVDYVIRTYTSEEAKMLITNRKHLSHTEPIDNSLRLFNITGDSVYLRHAFRFDEKNKATILALQLQESGSKIDAKLPPELLEHEKNLKNEIARLEIRLQNADDSLQHEKSNATLRDRQIQLSELQKKFDDYPAYRDLKFIDNTTGINDLQAIIPREYAVLSYHVGDTNLLAFFIDKHHYTYSTTKIDSSFGWQIRELYQQIQLTDQNTGARIRELSTRLYLLLIAPFQDQLNGKKKLMIIPDDELSFLPFEILRPAGGDMLVKNFAISYNYSCSLLKKPDRNKNGYTSVLAMAPFVKELPASESEISSIKGGITGADATKDVFLRKAPGVSLIHLATHATANDSVPSRSYIDFYASRLYTPEIAQLQLSSVKLVILSACETAKGQLVKGEGLMSLTRSFSYAGCQNIIASLWKADDVSTADISKALHGFLEDGTDPSEALHKSVLGYLDSDRPLRLKLPAYWAHLRLIGTFENDSHRNSFVIWIMIAAAIILGSIVISSMRRS